jgi:2-amino-4-hydroxy-6-hydroxymethyldihydropteridine diphosphokinase/dihydroneopterin aldolase
MMSDTATPLIVAACPDRIVVRAHVVETYVGVHDFERLERQRVRFDVEVDTVDGYADIVRATGEYVSYADIVEFVEARAASRDHVELVETWAEDVARFVLARDQARHLRRRGRRRCLDRAPASRRPTDVTTTCLVALGSNLGDRLESLRAGVRGVDAIDGVDVISVSKLYETAPVGGPDDQGAYLNAALLAEASLAAADLLRELHRIEAGRERERIVHWGPRTLDLDLLVYGDLVFDDPSLQVPHPRQHERRFVMVPVCDVAPDLIHPQLGRTMAELLADLPVEPGDLWAIEDDWLTSPEGTTS